MSTTNLDLALAQAELRLAQLKVEKESKEREEGYSTKGPRRCKYGANCHRQASCRFGHPKAHAKGNPKAYAKGNPKAYAKGRPKAYAKGNPKAYAKGHTQYWTPYNLRKNLHGCVLKVLLSKHSVFGIKRHVIDGKFVLGVTEFGHFLASEDGEALKENLKQFQSEEGFKQTQAIQELLKTSHTLEVVDITESLGTATTQYGIRLKEDSKVSADEAASGDDASADEAASE
jgi:hypothetical protein